MRYTSFVQFFLGVAFVSVVATSSAVAQTLVMPKYGGQFVSAGFKTQPALVFDASTPSNVNSPFWGVNGLFTLGYQHLVTPEVLMALEVGLGAQYLPRHTLTPQPPADAEWAFAWEAGLLGRWIPSATMEGFSVGGGLQFFQAHLEKTSFQVLGLEARLGYFWWFSNQRFVSLELGYIAPLIEGLTNPSPVLGEPAPAASEDDANFQRLNLIFAFRLI